MKDVFCIVIRQYKIHSWAGDAIEIGEFIYVILFQSTPFTSNLVSSFAYINLEGASGRQHGGVIYYLII